MKSAARHALYEYLAHFLPCSKDTLMKRAKRLFNEEEERHVTEPLEKYASYLFRNAVRLREFMSLSMFAVCVSD